MEEKTEAARFRVDTIGFVSFLIAAACFLSIVLVNERNYNDSWILDGILIPTLGFVFIFFLLEAFVRSNEKIAIMTACFLVVIHLIPGIKYQYFYNTYDSTFHFRFTNEISRLGHVQLVSVSGAPSATEYYVGSPGMHVLMSALSTVSGISINEIFRFVMPAIYGIIPLVVFFVTNNILAKNVQRYCMIASAFPIAKGYIVTGTNLSIVLYLLFFAVFLRLCFAKHNKTKYFVVLTILGLTLVISHPVTPVFVAMLLVGLPVGLKILHFLRSTRFPKLSAAPYLLIAMLFLAILMTWWANLAIDNLTFFTKYLEKVLSFAAFMEKPVVPTRFNEIPLWAQINMFSVLNMEYVVVVTLSLFGLLVFLRSSTQKEANEKSRSLYAHLLVLIVILFMYVVFLLGFGFQVFSYERFLNYSLPFCIFFSGLALLYLNIFLSKLFSKVFVRKLLFAFILFILFSSSLVQFFNCQPMVPRASVLGKNFSENEYIGEVQLLNTVFQKKMISFVEEHSSEGRIFSDIVTGWQIFGFSNGSLYLRRISGSSLEQNPLQMTNWDLFLLHTRKAGPFQEQLEYRTQEKIESLRTQAGNLIYDNGESFVISRVYKQ